MVVTILTSSLAEVLTKFPVVLAPFTLSGNHEISDYVKTCVLNHYKWQSLFWRIIGEFWQVEG
jgi:hypothetical protein